MIRKILKNVRDWFINNKKKILFITLAILSFGMIPLVWEYRRTGKIPKWVAGIISGALVLFGATNLYFSPTEEVVRAAANRRWISGIESGGVLEFQGTLGTAPTADGTIKRTADYSLKVLSPAAQRLAYIGLNDELGLSDTATYVQFWLYIDNLPSVKSKAFVLEDNAAVNIIDLWIHTDGKINVTSDLPSGLSATSTTALSEDTWYRIEVKCVIDDSVGEIVVRINGSEEISETSLDTKGVGSPVIDGLYWGNSIAVGGATGDWYFDDLVVDQAEYPGGTSVDVMMPNGSGTGDTPDSGDYDDCDEIPINDGDEASFTTSNAVGIAFDLEDTSATAITGTIYSVLEVARRERTTGPGTVHELRERDNGTDYDTTVSVGTSYDTFRGPIRMSRPGGGSFTTTVLDSYQAGFAKESGTQDSLASWIGLMVEFGEAAEEEDPPDTHDLWIKDGELQIKDGVLQIKS